MKKALLVVAAFSVMGVLPAVSAAGVSTSSSARGSAAAILAKAVAAADLQKSVALTVTSSLLGITVDTTTISGDSSSETHLRINGHTGEIIFSHNVVYARLDAALVNFEFHNSVPSVANKWIAISARDRYFSSLALGTTLSSVLRELTPARTLKESSSSLHGIAAVALAGTSNATLGFPGGAQTLYVSPTPPFLPLGGTIHVTEPGLSLDVTIAIKSWGVVVNPKVPATSVPIASTPLK